MELPIAPSWNWNIRTKYPFSKRWILPIAPSWNWNYQLARVVTLQASPNRTKLELKQLLQFLMFSFSCSQSHQAGIETSSRECFFDAYSTPNRTKLELKLRCWSPCDIQVSPPNRTKLELKRQCGKNKMKTQKISQSHQAGIETLCRESFTQSLNFSQSHQAGIETSSVIWFSSFSMLPIAPSWNWNCRPPFF